MPRLPPSLFRNARQINSSLALLLSTCRTLPSAHNELRWLREHVIKLSESQHLNNPRLLLYQLCLRRSRSEPLQYILGDQPFGDLDILCRPGVLIPRVETEAYTLNLARLIRQNISTLPALADSKAKSLRILDLCTGTGCIPLLLHSLSSPYIAHLTILGIDISAKAISLAKRNREWNIEQGKLQPIAREQIQFIQGDVLDEKFTLDGKWDIVISNPPYISPRGFNKETSRSVRNFEPRLALVPPLHDVAAAKFNEKCGDLFYPRLLEIASGFGAQLLLMEIDGDAQAGRVAHMVQDTNVWDSYNIWRDDLSIDSIVDGISSAMAVESDEILSVRKGRERLMVCWRGEGAAWLGRYNI